MSNAAWYVCIQERVLGPLSTSDLIFLLKENRFHFSDFAWREGMRDWSRISDVEVFSAHLPPKPEVQLPTEVKLPTDVKVPPAPKKSIERKKEPEPEKIEEPAPPPLEKKIPDSELRFVRVPLTGKIKVKGGGSYLIVNFAIGGLLVTSKELLPVGMEIQFTFESPVFEKAMELSGVVVRHVPSEEKPGFAVEFQRVNPSYRRLFENYVRNWKEN